jgi:transketolase
MGAIALGIAHHGGAIPYTATFLPFADYMRPPIRLAALAKQQVIFIFTHDSIGVGEDGPTHQPVEQITSLRIIPNLWVFRPADANETAVAWRQAILRKEGPTALILSRQNLPIMDAAVTSGAGKGAYIVVEAAGGQVDVILLATGSEVQLAIKAAEQLASESINARVVSMPCWELFEQQSDDYRQSVISKGTAKVAIEAGCSAAWYKYIGEDGGLVTIDRFGASAPGDVVMDKYGFNVGNVVQTVKATLSKAS